MSIEDEDDANMLFINESSSGGPPPSPPSRPPRARGLLISPPPPPPIVIRSLHVSMKPNPRLLSFFLQAIVMAFVISLFFLFVGIAIIFLIHICVSSGAFRRRRRRRSRFRSSGGDDVKFCVGLSPEDLQKLPCFDYGAAAENGFNSDCAVCLEGFRDGERCRVLRGCKHVFHVNCIDGWLVKVPACPICRSGVELGSSSVRRIPGK
ncbi:PREDICTED: RING-H2 finger protein ATL56-like [Nelumbo nucifera]|uniref:RING-type domain-containing protein n=2 Tax=Nelumbo nucifera TaxID=4432 RepID=A0A822ZL09_NELNU|nr:PREDICTED: RING-H2 finger protein ATL56-like [Nelumbo nucifera]DAD45577.1 TPA_asm: hypothetical protein HUJ06_003807 [Nelumbo nucifera]